MTAGWLQGLRRGATLARMGTNADEIRSDFLFARPSLIEGVGRLVDFRGSLNSYNDSPSPSEADARAIFEDWRAIGHDVEVALDEVREEVAQQR